jgi:hypothetical protein
MWLVIIALTICAIPIVGSYFVIKSAIPKR